LDENAFAEWNSKFPPGRRKQHKDAYDDLLLNPIKPSDTYRSMFIKRELTLKGGTEYTDFDPRGIQGVSHRANVCLGPFVAKASKQLSEKWNVNTRLCYTSGCTAEELGQWRSQFEDQEVTIFEIDFERFDAHQLKDAHKCEERFFVKCGINEYPDAKFVFKSQKVTVGFSPHGVYFKTKYRRKSGDPNTSCGNSYINGRTGKSIFKSIGLEDNYMLVQGDDNLVVVYGHFSEKKKAWFHKRIKDAYLSLGFKVKLKITEHWHEAEFCSALFWPVKDGYVLGPKIGRRLPKIGFSLKKLTQGQVKGMLLGGIKECKFIPVLRTYFKCCLNDLKTVKKENYIDHSYKYKSMVTENHELSDDTEEFFYNRYGVSMTSVEMSLEETLKRKRSFTSMVSWEDLYLFMAVDL